MNKATAALLVLILLVAFSTTAWAQVKPLTDTSYIDRAQDFVDWLKSVVKEMEAQLKNARQAQDTMKIECIEKRLADLQKLLAEIKASYKQMREHSFNKKIPALRNEFSLVDQKRKIAEQLVKLVNDCLGKSFHDGFTETVEEFLGRYFDIDPTISGWENYFPEPLPPIYEPRPASLAENE